MTLLLLGNKIIIGARQESRGAAYIWEYEAPSLLIPLGHRFMEQRLVYSDYNGAEGADGFGYQVAILGDKAIVTSPRDEIIKNGATIPGGGAARVFQQDSATGTWAMTEVIHSVGGE